MKLGFDIDGIVADMAQAMVDFMNEKYDLSHTVEIFQEHNISKNMYVEDEELSKVIAMDTYKSIIENDDAVVALKPHKDAVAAIRHLRKSGHTAHFITARPAEQKDATIEWFRKNKIPFDTLDVVGVKGFGNGNRATKGTKARSLNLDFFIDDHVTHLDNVYRHKKRWRKGLGLYTRPWNAEVPVDGNIVIRFNNWKQVVRHLGIHKR